MSNYKIQLEHQYSDLKISLNIECANKTKLPVTIVESFIIYLRKLEKTTDKDINKILSDLVISMPVLCGHNNNAPFVIYDETEGERLRICFDIEGISYVKPSSVQTSLHKWLYQKWLNLRVKIAQKKLQKEAEYRTKNKIMATRT